MMAGSADSAKRVFLRMARMKRQWRGMDPECQSSAESSPSGARMDIGLLTRAQKQNVKIEIGVEIVTERRERCGEAFAMRHVSVESILVDELDMPTWLCWDSSKE
ncbi:hypothetical protein KIN20_015619 [Parelaphostrongylus tenuis]|uniref:Uncharacterized protein n=1 Tax=Parelaphostrongylus tenuis TaxID=148309 RepID=A0AAD5QSL2_PARTN|nr:hypothetical protein KIN20_015619 [Parelaphostrongylus tenuis]